METTRNSSKKKKMAKESKKEGPTISKTKSSNENQKVEEEEEKKKKKNKRTNEIDEIFQGIKAKRLKETSAREEDEAAEKKAKAKKKGDSKKPNGGAVAGEGQEVNRPRRRKTADGLTIYSAEELGFGNPNAGGTPLCPLDCSCCF